MVGENIQFIIKKVDNKKDCGEKFHNPFYYLQFLKDLIRD